MTPSRTDVVVIILFSSVAVGIPALVIARHFLGMDPIGWLPMPGKAVAGWIVFAIAALVCGWNFYLSFVRPWLYKRKHANLDGYAGPSGLPVIGGIFVAVAAVLLPASVVTGTALLVLYAIDGYGLPPALYAIFRYGV